MMLLQLIIPVYSKPESSYKHSKRAPCLQPYLLFLLWTCKCAFFLWKFLTLKGWSGRLAFSWVFRGCHRPAWVDLEEFFDMLYPPAEFLPTVLASYHICMEERPPKRLLSRPYRMDLKHLLSTRSFFSVTESVTANFSVTVDACVYIYIYIYWKTPYFNNSPMYGFLMAWIPGTRKSKQLLWLALALQPEKQTFFFFWRKTNGM